MIESIRRNIAIPIGVMLCFYTLIEVNYPHLQTISTYALFTMMGMVLCFLNFPAFKFVKKRPVLNFVDFIVSLGLSFVTIFCCLYVVIQSEEVFKDYWYNDVQLGNRIANEVPTDFLVAILGVVAVLECTRRAIGWVVPALALVFIFHSFYCHQANVGVWPAMPDWLLPHAGQELNDIASTAFLNDAGVFGIAASVMFKYVFLFVIFGAFLEISGATKFIIAFAELVLGFFPGGPALVSVAGSGLMGSLSGSAVANAVTTGSFTIPMMRNSGFDRQTAGGITAAAASGGALVPPVMGAGAYMMLELVQPAPDFKQIIRAAAIPAALYYLSLATIVYFYSRRMGSKWMQASAKPKHRLQVYDGVIFITALAVLLGMLYCSFTAFRSVSAALVAILLLTTFKKRLNSGTEISLTARVSVWMAFIFGVGLFFVYQMVQGEAVIAGLSGRKLFDQVLDASFIGMLFLVVVGIIYPTWSKDILGALTKASKNGVSLVAASACVGIIIAIVAQTGIAASFGDVIKAQVEQNLFLALFGIMICSIVMGMGVPSVVCYLLMATMMGTMLSELGVIPLGAHLFIFYFGLMSMVTPPVALAAYASASIAESNIMKTSFAAFRFSLVGFTLPYMFIYRPALLLMSEEKWNDYFVGVESNAANLSEIEAIAGASYPGLGDFLVAVIAAVVGIIALAAGISGYINRILRGFERGICFVAAALLLVPVINLGDRDVGPIVNLVGGLMFLGLVVLTIVNRPTNLLPKQSVPADETKTPPVKGTPATES